MSEEEMEIDGVSEEINSDDRFDDEEEFDEDEEFDDEDEELEDELFKENPLKAIWLKLKELSE